MSSVLVALSLDATAVCRRLTCRQCLTEDDAAASGSVNAPVMVRRLSVNISMNLRVVRTSPVTDVGRVRAIHQR